MKAMRMLGIAGIFAGEMNTPAGSRRSQGAASFSEFGFISVLRSVTAGKMPMTAS